MPEEITKEIFEKLVNLASLALKADESEYLRGQLNAQLKSVHELEAIPLTEDIPLARHGVPFPPEISPTPRIDHETRFPDPGRIINQAPQTAEGYIVVPDIPHTKLE